jgi:hypothetical protein
MRTKARCVFLFVSVLVINAAADDDFLHPHQSGISIRSEKVLSGIDLQHGTIDDAIAKLGKPSAIKTVRIVTEFNVTFVERNYEWQRKGCLVRIVAGESGGRNRIESMDVRGTRPQGVMGTTGRGLKLGNSIRDARRIYNLGVYFGITQSERGSSPFLSPNGCPLAPEPILKVDFDKQGRVNHMIGPLTPTPCY